MAMDRVLLRGTGDDDEATDPRAVAAGFVSVVERLADESLVIIAIDDLQWLDTSSRQVVAFAARRLVGRVALLGTVRTEPQHSAAVSWLQLPRVDAVDRIRLQPLSLGKLHGVLVDRLGLSLPRPTMVRIHEISGGNPFYALELARTTGGAAPPGEMAWPGTLAELVQDRIGRFGADAREALLVVACAATPTIELVARVTDSTTERRGAVGGCREQWDRRDRRAVDSLRAPAVGGRGLRRRNSGATAHDASPAGRGHRRTRAARPSSRTLGDPG